MAATRPQMHSLIRTGGVVAVVAGVLRALASFAPAAGEVEQQVLYLVVDCLLLFAVLAVYAQNHEALGVWGASGFLIVVAGILLVRSSRSIPGVDLYPAGALAVVAGWVLLSAAWRKRARGSALVLLLFASAAVAGLIGQLVVRAAALGALSGILFGAAMIAVGGHVLRPLRVTTTSSRHERDSFLIERVSGRRVPVEIRSRQAARRAHQS
jgi:hypothetical protein